MPESNKQRLWIVSELYYPEETSTGYYMTKIAEGLAGDADVHALCGQPTYSKRGTRAAKTEIHNGVSIKRAAGTTLDKNVIPFRIVNILTLGASIFLSALRRFKKGDRILVVTTPPTMPFVAAIASLVKGCSYTLLIHDSYPELLVAVGKTKEASFFFRLMSMANRWLYKHASQIIVVGRDMAEMTKRKTEGLDIPVVTIPNWAELENVSPTARDQNPLIKELSLEDKLIFLYAGNMGHPNDIESLVEAAHLLSGEDAHFVFLGTGVKRKWLEREVANLELSNVTILDPKPRTEQQIFLNACDVAIVSLVQGMKGVSMPSRTYNALAAGKPILALTEAGSEIDLVVKENSIGWTVSPQNTEDLVVLIREILERRPDLTEMAERARTAAERDFSLEDTVKAYRSVLLAV